MATQQCPECGEWVDDAVSDVCPSCGELVNPDGSAQ